MLKSIYMNFLLLAQIIISVLLIAFILLQAKGTGLGSAWGGSGEFYRTKRGAERVLFGATIVLAILFIGFSLVSALI